MFIGNYSLRILFKPTLALYSEMAQDRIRMPMSEGGLVRYGEETKSKFVIKPEVVVGLGIAIIIVAVALQVLF